MMLNEHDMLVWQIPFDELPQRAKKSKYNVYQKLKKKKSLSILRPDISAILGLAPSAHRLTHLHI